MEAHSTMIKITLVACSLALFMSLIGNASPIIDDKKEASPGDFAFGEDGSLWLAGTECASDEIRAIGKSPECEPTCENKKPACIKMFYIGLDTVPCFCKSPMVRNKATKKCVMPEDCPK